MKRHDFISSHFLPFLKQRIIFEAAGVSILVLAILKLSQSLIGLSGVTKIKKLLQKGEKVTYK